MFNLIYYQFFFTPNGLGHQSITTQLFQPLAPLTLARVGTAIHGALAEFATANIVTLIPMLVMGPRKDTLSHALLVIAYNHTVTHSKASIECYELKYIS